MVKKTINRNNYYTRKQLKELGMNADEVVRWIGNYDRKDKNTFFYSKKRCDEILDSPKHESLDYRRRICIFHFQKRQ